MTTVNRVKTRTAWGRLAASALSAALLLAVAGAATAQDMSADEKAKYEAAKKEGTLVLYTGRSVEQIQQIIGAFEKKYPGIKVDFFRADTSQVVQRYETEVAAGRPSADVIDLVERRSQAFFQKGLATAYASPNLKDVPADAHAPNGEWTNYAMNIVSFAWNTDKVKPEDAPKSLQDLADPKWAGRVGMQDPVQGGGAAIWVITLAGVWDEGRWTDYMAKLGNQKPKYGNYMQVQNMLQSGEIDVMIAAYPTFVEPVRQRGAPLAWGSANPMVRTFFTLSLAKKPENPNAAKLFIDYLVSADGQKMLADIKQLPVLEAAWPESYKAGLQGAKYEAQNWQLEESKPDFFRERIREYFGKR